MVTIRLLNGLVHGLGLRGFRDVIRVDVILISSQIVEDQIEKNMDHEMEIGVIG